ncbi:MAG: restriction endonuclease [Myxococcales bacterium]|nr:restriction endonuclease [Myxococcales bacterium]
MNLTEEQLSVPHDPERSETTEVGYRMAWARTYLKKDGYLDNSSRGVWVLTQKGRETTTVDPHEVARRVRARDLERMTEEPSNSKRHKKHKDDQEALEEAEEGAEWMEELVTALQRMPADGFERLSQRLLRECGFVEVEVTGRKGDQGIDGIGVLRMHDVVSFRVVFQCKRWKGSVGPGVVRDFRGSMIGKAEKGIIITTGTFTREAYREATRAGAHPIDLIDGEELANLLKKFGLGVKSEMVERVLVDEDFFDKI